MNFTRLKNNRANFFAVVLLASGIINGQCPVTPYTTPYYSPVINSTLPLTPDNIRQNIANAITEPYPRVIAGTPLAYSYTGADANNQNGTFTFSYSKMSVTGCGSISSKLNTEVSIPSRSYPNGYSVAVTGADIVSNKDGLLILARHKDAAVVEVVVTP